MSRYKHVFEPMMLGTCEVPNRLFIPALTTNMGDHNLPSKQLAEYYEARARGGVGTIFMEGIRPSRSALARPPQLAGFLDDSDEAFRMCADVVHRHGARLFAQIVHVGRQGDGNCSRTPAWGASPVPWSGTGAVPHEMTHAEIRSVIDDQIKVVRMLREAGIDGVELHVGHGHLLQQFLSPASNFRTDIYGGSEENRMRFTLELIGAVREEMGADYPIGFRYSLHEYIDGGLTPEISIPILVKFVERLKVDFVHLSQSAYHGSLSVATLAPDMSFHDEYFRELTVKATAALRARGSAIPVLTVARFREVAQAEAMIADGHADMVGMGRALLADPEIVRKSREGREEEVVPCTSCNQGCLGRNWTALPITCMSNPAVGKEGVWPAPASQPAQRRKSVLVVGGGPAGLEAAHVAAARGHKVSLWEAGSQLGGQLAIAARFARRGDHRRLVNSLIARCERQGVDINLDRRATPDAIRHLGADEIVFATGSNVRAKPLAGAAGVLSVDEFAENFDAVGQRVAVFDTTGGYTMMAVVEQLMASGREIALITPGGAPGWGIVPYSLYGLMHRFREHAVRMHPMRKLVSFDAGDLLVADPISGLVETCGKFDHVIVVDNNVARDEHRAWFDGESISHRSIGDCLAPRSAIEAVYEGHEVARAL
ncbi:MULTISPECIES: FAD-dependent oxidoreductase [unclassified Chelatococcus]|uniref:oxidoreductase n=1 Tax=unclassified Chelatococcus TaxID=2638111 RepID=UPI001BCC16CD|nr:FAD-dependent oxidoreductase [Chelatococcus sp.]MBS7700626.1 FAD-dependent oxidoreductase [Chelatococcus sp. YT9]MBX3559057.1 FAD-dependent oxidoreductase [Chelatococcus sp.]